MYIDKSGTYRLFETPGGVKILELNNTEAFVWITVPKIGDLLVRSRHFHTIHEMLAIGRFRVHDTRPEVLPHSQVLSLEIDNGFWQHYRLPAGLPTSWHKRSRIIPTFYAPAVKYISSDQAALPV